MLNLHKGRKKKLKLNKTKKSELQTKKVYN